MQRHANDELWGGLLDVDIGEDDGCVVAAELESHTLKGLRAGSHDLLARRDGAGKGDFGDIWVSCEHWSEVVVTTNGRDNTRRVDVLCDLDNLECCVWREWRALICPRRRAAKDDATVTWATEKSMTTSVSLVFAGAAAAAATDAPLLVAAAAAAAGHIFDIDDADAPQPERPERLGAVSAGWTPLTRTGPRAPGPSAAASGTAWSRPCGPARRARRASAPTTPPG